MKICFIASNLNLDNGDGRFASSMIKAFQELGIETLVFVDRNERELLGAKAMLYKGGVFKKFIIGPILIAKALRGEKIDVIHAFDAWPKGIIAYFSHLLAGVPFGMTIYATYGVLPLTKSFKSFLLKAAYKKSILNAAISQITAEKIKNLMPKADIKVINQGIDFKKYQGHIVNQKIVSNPYILSVAYMKPRKGYHYAIPAFAEIKKIFPELKYVIRAAESDGKYFERIKNMASDLGVDKDIIWLPRLEESELVDVYKNAEVFFLPSVSSDPVYFEGFGSIYLEAQACGVPVVTSKGGGQEDAIVDGKTGFLIEEGNIDEAVEALKKIITNKSLRKEFSKNAIEFARLMSWNFKVEEYLNYYHNAIG